MSHRNTNRPRPQETKLADGPDGLAGELTDRELDAIVGGSGYRRGFGWGGGGGFFFFGGFRRGFGGFGGRGFGFRRWR
jgi:hypothetical protein